MYYNTLFKIIALWCMVVCVLGEAKPKTITIQGQIFDQHPFFNNNFEPNEGNLREGLVKAAIDPINRVPILNSLSATNTINVAGRMITPALFQHFFKANLDAPFSSNSGRNYPLLYDLVLTLDEANDVYVYNNQAFFPINKKGFFDPLNTQYSSLQNNYKNQAGQISNFHFCLRVNNKFTYQGYEKFDFTGDDDVWVFINDKLAIDLGGLHSSESKSVSLSKLGLTKGMDYNFDFFYCERHTTASTIKITTNLQVYCAWYDYCVCQGDGTSCCTPGLCTDRDACTIDACPHPKTVIPSGKTFLDFCTHDYDDHYCDDKSDACVKYQCVSHIEQDNGGIYEWATCDVKSNVTTCPISDDDINKCFDPNVKCDPKVGCVKKDKCASSLTNCNTGKCDNGNCVEKTDEDCYEEQHNYCSVFTCVKDRGCVKTGPKCPVDLSEPCKINSCDYQNGTCTSYIIPDETCTTCCYGTEITKCQVASCLNGQCNPLNKVDLPEFDDNNPCTINTCDEETGNMVYTAIPCGGCETCNRENGKCEPNHLVCPKENDCAVQNCVHIGSVDNVPTGECQNGVKECGQDDPDKCKIWSCNTGIKVDESNPDANCNFTQKVCPDKGNCLVGQCNSGTGECVYSNRVCESPAFCIVAECNEALGCIQYDRRCSADDGRCQKGVCVNGTSPTDGKCESVNYDPQPFVCKTAAVVSTAVIAGVTVAGAVALAAFIYGGKKGYDYWKETRDVKFSGSTSNPLYVESPNGGVNPLYGSGTDA